MIRAIRVIRGQKIPPSELEFHTLYHVTHYLSYIDHAGAVWHVSGMPPRYKVTLTQTERGELEALTKNGRTTAPSFVHARALLLCDAGRWGDPWTVADIAGALGVTPRTIEHLKQRFVEEGLEAALQRKPRSTPPKLVFDGARQARITALACSQAPKGRSRWTVRLLAEKVVELKIAPSISPMTVQRLLKKTNLSLT